MGYLRPTALIVTGSYRVTIGDKSSEHWAERARDKALEIFGAVDDEAGNLLDMHLVGCVSELSEPLWNDARSFAVFWDGSKEGWQPSDLADDARARFVAWLREQAYGDGSSPLDWNCSVSAISEA